MTPRTVADNMNVQLQINHHDSLPRILHANEENIDQSSISLMFGHEYEINIYPSGRFSTDGFKQLSLDQRGCRLSHEVLQASVFMVYTKTNCRYECHVTLAFEKCHCIPWDFVHNKTNVSECDIFGRTCFYQMIANLTHDTFNHCPQCIRECDKIEYKKIVRLVKPLYHKPSSKKAVYCNTYLCSNAQLGQVLLYM